MRMGASKCALSTSGSFGIEQINFRTRNGSNLKFSRQFLAVLARRGSEACILLSMMRWDTAIPGMCLIFPGTDLPSYM